MINLLHDFWKWRKERHQKVLIEVIKSLDIPYPAYEPERCEGYRDGILYGIKHRKEILKKAKSYK